jgi:hypothetical protein
MRTSAALLRRQPGAWDVCEVELDSLAEINQGYADLHAGEIIRGIVRFEE